MFPPYSTVTRQTAPLDPDTLYYPRQLCEAVGLGVNQINGLKRIGCPFYGRKTTLRWVRDFLAAQAGAAPQEPATLPPSYLPLTAANICGGPTDSND